MTAPVADGFVGGIFQCPVARLHRSHLCSQHLHPLHVHMLTLHVESSLIDDARHVHQSTYCGGGHAMLTSSCLGYDTLLAHLLGQQNLSDGVVDFVCAGVVQVFAFQVKAATIFLTHASGQVEWTGAPHIVA